MFAITPPEGRFSPEVRVGGLLCSWIKIQLRSIPCRPSSEHIPSGAQSAHPRYRNDADFGVGRIRLPLSSQHGKSLGGRQQKYEAELSKTIVIINASFLVTWLSENIAIVYMTLFQNDMIMMQYETYKTTANALLFLNLLFPFNGGFNSAVYLIRVKRLKRLINFYMKSKLNVFKP